LTSRSHLGGEPEAPGQRLDRPFGAGHAARPDRAHLDRPEPAGEFEGLLLADGGEAGTWDGAVQAPPYIGLALHRTDEQDLLHVGR
jgi:hypothetical protein